MLSDQRFPWRDGRPLEAVLADARPWLLQHRIIRRATPELKAVADLETKLGRPLPDELRTLWSLVVPNPSDADEKPIDFSFEPPDGNVSWQSLAGDEFKPPENWINANGLAIGQTVLGDDIYYTLGHRVYPQGCLVLFSHDAANGGLLLAVIARSLAELISKVVHLNGIRSDGGEELDDQPAGRWPLPLTGRQKQALYDAEFAELNPAAEGV